MGVILKTFIYSFYVFILLESYLNQTKPIFLALLPLVTTFASVVCSHLYL